MYIAQWIAKHTSHSRRSAVELVKAGRVTRNDQRALVTDRVEPGDRICFNDQPIATGKTLYVMLHKPVGYVCTRTAQDRRPTVYDLLPKEYQHLTYAGRLDADSSGLLLMSNDGEWVNKLTHPRYRKEKIYELTLNKPLQSQDLEKVEKGIRVEDYTSQIRLEKHTTRKQWVASLTMGRNRQIRKTFSVLGYTVTKLHRIQMGEYKLGRLKAGEYKLIEPVL